MTTFKNNFTLGVIKEVGEEDILITVNGVDSVIPLDDSNREPILDAVSEGLYMIPVDAETHKVLMTVDTQTLYEVFPEIDLEELQGAADDDHETIEVDE